MNFYKEEEKNSRNRNKQILSFGEKRKKKIMCRTDSDYFPKITKTMTTRNSSANNTAEEFGNIKVNKRILKERKKKFINFNVSDLKLLKMKKNKSDLNDLFFNLMSPIIINKNYYNKNRKNQNNIKILNNEVNKDILY